MKKIEGIQMLFRAGLRYPCTGDAARLSSSAGLLLTNRIACLAVVII